MKIKSTAIGLAFTASLLATTAARAVEIEYWQYVFETRVNAVDQLIERFEAENPGITVKHVTFPYADYQTKVIASHAAGEGPDVVQYFYGWLDKFAEGGVLQPLSPEVFPTAEIEAEFFPIVEAVKRGESYYGLPTAVRSLALFYNKALVGEAGVEVPTTLDELIEAAGAIAKHDGSGNYSVLGITVAPEAQDHHWWREALVRQFGGAPYDADGNVTYNSEAGAAAFKWYTDLQTAHHLGSQGFLDTQTAAFTAGLAGFTIDGTFRLGNFRQITAFEWGVTELPANAEGVRGNYSSYFANGIGAGAQGEELEAAEKFLAYLASEEAQSLWLEVVGELPARRAVALTDENLANPEYGPFIRGLEYATTTLFVDEAASRQAIIDAFNRVVLEGVDPATALDGAAASETAAVKALSQ